VTLNVSTQGMRLIDKKGITKVVKEMRSRGVRV